jgi:TRAP-type C4-dicarboxylate transport system permease small subunit
MRLLRKLIRLLESVNFVTVGACKLLTVLTVAAITLIVCAGVYWRYVLNDSLSWSEESAKFLMVWMVFVGAPIALAQGGHAAIDALQAALPPRLRQALFSLVYLLILFFLVVLVYQGSQYAWNARIQATPTTGISMLYIYACLPVGGAVMLLISLELFLKSLLGIQRPEWGVHPPDDPTLPTTPMQNA